MNIILVKNMTRKCAYPPCYTRKVALGLCDKHYRKTKYAFISKCYKNMKQRVTGIQKTRNHIYYGLDLLDREKFIKWTLNNKDFHNLFAEWEKLGYDRSQTPSIDRKDNSLGYLLNNIRWITNSENSRLGAVSEKRK